MEKLDKLLAEQKKKNKKLQESTYWSRNKKLIITITVILVLLYIFTQLYAYYWIERIYNMANNL